MNRAKCDSLKKQYANEPVPLVPITRFFDGNDDLGSIGCNLMSHPGMDAFREVLTGLLERPDVVAVYAQIAELDPGEHHWPFTDTVVVAGRISKKDLQKAVAALKPDEVGAAEAFGISDSVEKKHKQSVHVIWWD